MSQKKMIDPIQKSYQEIGLVLQHHGQRQRFIDTPLSSNASRVFPGYTHVASDPPTAAGSHNPLL